MPYPARACELSGSPWKVCCASPAEEFRPELTCLQKETRGLNRNHDKRRCCSRFLLPKSVITHESKFFPGPVLLTLDHRHLPEIYHRLLPPQVPSVSRVHANEGLPSSYRTLGRNVITHAAALAHAGCVIEATMLEAGQMMSVGQRKYDFVDLDPCGSPVEVPPRCPSSSSDHGMCLWHLPAGSLSTAGPDTPQPIPPLPLSSSLSPPSQPHRSKSRPLPHPPSPPPAAPPLCSLRPGRRRRHQRLLLRPPRPHRDRARLGHLLCQVRQRAPPAPGPRPRV